jgi:hypothetical protein
MNQELPFQTYERVTEQKWPGGRSRMVRLLLDLFGIHEIPGTAAANLQLQRALCGLFVAAEWLERQIAERPTEGK